MSHSLPTLGPLAHWAFPALERWSLRIFDFEAQQPCIQGDRKAVEADSLFNGACTNLIHPTSQYRGSHLKGGCQTHVLNLETPPHPETQEATGAHPRVINTLTQFTAVLGSSFWHKDTGAGRHHIGVLPSAYWHWRLTHSPAGQHEYWDTLGHTVSIVRTQVHLTSRQAPAQHPRPPSHLHQDLAFPTSRAVPSPRPPGPLSATLNPRTAPQQAGTKHGIRSQLLQGLVYPQGIAAFKRGRTLRPVWREATLSAR